MASGVDQVSMSQLTFWIIGDAPDECNIEWAGVGLGSVPGAG